MSDLCADMYGDKFKAVIGPALVEYVENGGRVAFPTTEGGQLVEVLKELFGVISEWQQYGRDHYGPPEGRSAAVDEIFLVKRLQHGKKLASEMVFSVNCTSLTNVPAVEQFFGNVPRPDTKYVPDEEDEPEKMVDDESQKMYMYSVAVAKYGPGKVAYFGDDNAEQATCDLIAAYCLA